jgi:hypothetical protein
MKPFRVAGWVCALALWAADAGATRAAWCNVFQVCCNHCGHRSAGFYSAPVTACALPAPCCPPPPVCTTRYTMRCYYQPVTCYQTRTYYEPVTTYRTSYYYDPVCTYRYSCYFDPCTCCYQQVAVPTTSYVLKARCCPVQSWVQRCCSVPVTTYQKSFYWEPSTTCCSPCSNPCCNGGATVPTAPPVQQRMPVVDEGRVQPRPPVVDEGRQPPRPPRIREGSGTDSGNGSDVERYYGSGYRQVPNRPGTVRQSSPVPPPPRARLDKIASAPVTHFEGQVVRRDNAPRPNVRLRFVSLTRRGPQYPVTANSAGRFRVNLPPGNWLVYLTTTDGRQVFHSKITVQGSGSRRVQLVTR